MDLAEAFAELEVRAEAEPALNRYRVAPGGPRALATIPDGWFVSDAVAALATDGGWWPGEWYSPLGPEGFAPTFESGDVASEDAEIRWVAIGTVWERDWFHTPIMRSPMSDAPLLGFSTQELWQSLEFPTEASLLQAFIATYDELGLDEYGMVDSMFVDWIGPPSNPDDVRAGRVHRRLIELMPAWSSTHPAWSAGHMPMRVADGWPDELSPNLAGVGPGRIRRWRS